MCCTGMVEVKKKEYTNDIDTLSAKMSSNELRKCTEKANFLIQERGKKHCPIISEQRNRCIIVLMNVKKLTRNSDQCQQGRITI
jgi:hypothetical protein